MVSRATAEQPTQIPEGERMTTPRLRRTIAGVMAAGLIIAACGSDDGGDSSPAATDAPVETDAPAATDAPVETDEPIATDASTDEGGGEALALEGSVEVAAGTVLNLDECPDDWDPLQGVDGDQIRIGQTLPLSGALAAFGAIAAGMQFYFDNVNATDPIEGKELILIAKDDGYEAGRGVANVEEMIDSDDIFAFGHVLGTPINAAVRPITDEACVPQLFNSSGFPLWGDPANYPWTVGNILNYVTVTNIWCKAITDEFGDGATVAALIMNNDFGKTYQTTLNDAEACSTLDIVTQEVHDPAGADVTNEMTTIIGTEADVFVVGTTAKFCTQAVAVLAASEWRPRSYMSYTCNNLASYFEPVKDAAAALAADGAGIYMANSNKVCGDPSYADDPAIVEIERVLAEYGNVTCADGSYSTGYLYGEFLVDVLRAAAALPGGLNRVNLMAATWNANFTSDSLLGGTLQLDGVNDAYWTEAAQIQEVVIGDAGNLTFEARGDIVDFEGQGGSFSG
jgi:branched-chain amino acid transport system substrate-binding protein